MSQLLPEPLRDVVEMLSRLPGLGGKSATRIAMTLLKWPESETRRLGRAVHDLRDKLGLCSVCNALSATDPCPVCASASRDHSLLCVVPEWDSLLAMEKGGFYNGLYFVLGGLLSPQTKTDSACLDLDKLLSRLAANEIQEVILALGATLEGENTASFLKAKLAAAFPHIKTTRLAQGIPLGGEVKHMDHETLRMSLQHRQTL